METNKIFNDDKPHMLKKAAVATSETYGAKWNFMAAGRLLVTIAMDPLSDRYPSNFKFWASKKLIGVNRSDEIVASGSLVTLMRDRTRISKYPYESAFDYIETNLSKALLNLCIANRFVIEDSSIDMLIQEFVIRVLDFNFPNNNDNSW